LRDEEVFQYFLGELEYVNKSIGIHQMKNTHQYLSWCICSSDYHT